MLVNMYAFSYTDSGTTKYIYSNYIPNSANSKPAYVLQNNKMVYAGSILYNTTYNYRLPITGTAVDCTREPSKDGLYEIDINGIYNKTLNLYIVGNPTINNKTISGFTGSNYLNFYKPLNCDISDIEFVISTIINISEDDKCITAGKPYNTLISLHIQGTNVKGYNSNNSITNNIFNGTNYPIPGNPATGDNYLFKYTFNKLSGKHTLSCKKSSDSSWTMVGEVNDETPPVFNGYVGFGADTGDSFKIPAVNSSIDLSETYIKINGEVWWSATSESVEQKESNFTSNIINAAVRAPQYLGNTLTKVPQNVSPYITIADDGTMVFKKGITVYIPNGFEADGVTRKFDTFILNSDRTVDYKSLRSLLYCMNGSSGSLYATDKNLYVIVGTEITRSTTERYIWYDTTNNLVKTSINKGEWVSGLSLPFCSVDCYEVNKFRNLQCFDYCGYMDSIVYTLPGIEGYIAAGLDSNNKPVNRKFVSDKVYTYSNTGSASNDKVLCSIGINENEIIRMSANVRPYVADNENQPNNNIFYYPPKNLLERNFNDGSGYSLQSLNYLYINADFNYTDSKVTRLTTYPLSTQFKEYEVAITGETIKFAEFKKSRYLGNTLTNTPANISPYLSIRQVNGNPELTLKAGAKLYFPAGKNEDGTNKFDEVILPQDIVRSDWGNLKTGIISIQKLDTGEYVFSRMQYDNVAYAVVSGDTQPTGLTADLDWYDTENNIIKHYDKASNTWSTGVIKSLPIMFIDNSKGESLDTNSLGTVFDWLGFCGNIIFCLPGLQGYRCNGKDSNGNSINVFRSVDNVLTYTYPEIGASSNSGIALASNDTITTSSKGYKTSDTFPENPTPWCYYYITSLNNLQVYNSTSSTWGIDNSLVLGLNSRIQGGQITSITPKKLG